MTLQDRHANNPWLLKFYEEGLLEPGWAGELDDVELEYIKSELRRSRALRRRWGSVLLPRGSPRAEYGMWR